MGLFDGRSYSDSERLRTPSRQHTSHSRSRGNSPARSTRSASNGHYVRPSNNRTSSSSFFGGTSRGIFSAGGSGSSYYKRRPRDGYISYLMNKLQRMIKELWYYARKHPVKAFFALVVPLLSAGGAIHGLMRQFGVSVPFGLDGAASRSGGGYYGSTGYSRTTRTSGGGWMDNAGSLMQIAKAFM